MLLISLIVWDSQLSIRKIAPLYTEKRDSGELKICCKPILLVTCSLSFRWSFEPHKAGGSSQRREERSLKSGLSEFSIYRYKLSQMELAAGRKLSGQSLTQRNTRECGLSQDIKHTLKLTWKVGLYQVGQLVGRGCLEPSGEEV